MHGNKHMHIHVNTRPNSSAKLNPERITKNGQKITKKKKKRLYYVVHSDCCVSGQIGFYCMFRDFARCTHTCVYNFT